MNKSYVYVLIDPTTDSIFYIGKGTNYRDSSHLKPSAWKNPENTTNPFLYHKIKSLMENDTPPHIVRLLENVSDEDAYQYESELISKLGRRFVDNGTLFNISDFKGGSYQGSKKPWSDERTKRHKENCKNKRIFDPDYQTLFQEYIIENMTRNEIATKYKVSDSLVKKRLQHYNIIKPKKNCYPEKNKFVCLRCNEEFLTPKSVSNRKYCSKKCYRSVNEVS